MEKARLSQSLSSLPERSVSKRRTFINTQLSVTKLAVFLLVCCFFYRIKSEVFPSFSGNSDRFSELADRCANVTPIRRTEFLSRQQNLAETLHALNASAFIAEPGPSARYYANVSSWGLSERPLLLIISPQLSEDGASVKPNVSILTPYFEKTRAQLMDIPSAEPLTYVSWREEVNPYETAVTAIPSLTPGGPIFVEGELRAFILDGLSKASPSTPVLAAPLEIQRLRQRKSSKEIEIMKCVNEVTLLAVREVRERMYFGIKQSEVGALLSKALASAGLRDGEGLVLFGDNAARPHGGGGDSTLGISDFVLIDTGGTLHEYYSDLTRTFALPGTRLSKRQLQIWYDVQEAQSAALAVAKNGTLTRTVDEAARGVLEKKGLADYFTHRLGHGIGIEMHESPYLTGGSEDLILTGHTFSDEPGVYIDGDVGVRLEDSFYINDDGDGIYLTEAVGGQAKSPWDI